MDLLPKGKLSIILGRACGPTLEDTETTEVGSFSDEGQNRPETHSIV